MVNSQLLEYVKSQLLQGIGRDVIKSSLIASGGWTPIDIEEAFIAAQPATTHATSIEMPTSTPGSMPPPPTFTPTSPAQSQVPPRQYSSPHQSQSRYSTHKRGGIFKIIFAIIIILASVAAGTYAVFAYVVQPEAAISDAIRKIGETDQIHSELKLSIISASSTTSEASLIINTDADNTDISNRKVHTNVSILYPGFSGSFEVKVIDNKLYGRMIDYPEYLSSYENKVGNIWYSISLDALKKMIGDYYASSTISITEIPSFDKIYDGLMSSGVVSALKFSGISKGTFGLVRNYTFEINKDVLLGGADALEDVVGTNNSYTTMGKSMLAAVDISEVTISTSLFSGSLREVHFTIGSDMMPIKLAFDLGYDDTMTVSEITKPDAALSLDSYLLESRNDALDRGEDARVMATLAQARVAAEEYYNQNSSYRGICTQAQSMKPFFTEMTKIGTSLFCSSSQTSYVMAAKLNDKSGLIRYSCVDSTGVVNQNQNELPKGMSCTKSDN